MSTNTTCCFIFPFPCFPPLLSHNNHHLPLCLLSEMAIKLARLYASVVRKDVLKDWLCGLMNKQLLPPYMPLFLSLSLWLRRDLKSYTEVCWELICQQKKQKTKKKSSFGEISEHSQMATITVCVLLHTQGGLKALTSGPAGWIRSRMSDYTLLPSSQSAVGKW